MYAHVQVHVHVCMLVCACVYHTLCAFVFAPSKKTTGFLMTCFIDKDRISHNSSENPYCIKICEKAQF